MATIEPNQTGVREDLSDYISAAEMKDTPVTSMIPKGKKPGNMRLDWQMDADLDNSTGGVLDGTDVTSYQDAAENRELGSVYCQWFRQSAKVGTLAQDVSNVAGVSEKEKARAVMKVLTQVKQNIEARISGDDDTTAQSGATAYTTRGLGSWINNTAQATLPVPSAYRTPTTSIDSTASTAAATEASINDVVKSIYNETGKVKDFEGIVGSNMKSRISDLQLYDANSSAGTAYIAARHINKDQMSNTIAKKIDIMVGDFGTIKIHVSNFLGWSGGSLTTAVGRGRFYILDMKDLELCFSKTPGVEDFPDLGGGPRFAVDGICGLKVGNCLRHGALKPTAV